MLKIDKWYSDILFLRKEIKSRQFTAVPFWGLKGNQSNSKSVNNGISNLTRNEKYWLLIKKKKEKSEGTRGIEPYCPWFIPSRESYSEWARKYYPVWRLDLHLTFNNSTHTSNTSKNLHLSHADFSSVLCFFFFFFFLGFLILSWFSEPRYVLFKIIVKGNVYFVFVVLYFYPFLFFIFLQSALLNLCACVDFFFFSIYKYIGCFLFHLQLIDHCDLNISICFITAEQFLNARLFSS